MAEERDLWQLIEDLSEQVKENHADIAALVARAEASDVRADAADVRAEAAEARADRAESRAKSGDVRVDRIEAAELLDRQMIAELQVDGELSREHARQMEEALRSSRVIGSAMGVLMASRNLTEDEAFVVLSKASQDSNRKVRDVAQLIVRGVAGGGQTR